MESVQPKKSDKYIPYYFVAFFVFLAIADGFFVYLAASTHTGVVKEHAYEKGLNYNQVVQAQKTQEQLGWKPTLSLMSNKVRIEVLDKNNLKLDRAKVSIHFKRPTQSGYDFSMKLPEVAAATYEANITFPLLGQWDATMLIEKEGQPYQKRERIIVQ